MLGDGEQVGGPLALLPQRRALVGPAARQQQRAPGALAESRREQRRLRQRRHDDVLDVVGVDADRVDRQLVGCLRETEHDAVVAPHRLDGHAVVVGQAPLDGHRPRRVDGCAERAEDADPPVADLVAEALDDDRAVVGDDAGGFGLLAEVLQQVVRRQLVEGVFVAQPAQRRLWRRFAQLAYERTERSAQLERPAGTVAVPERHLARLAGRRRDRDPLERDVLDAPRRRPEHERLAGPALVHHLLVELADPLAIGQEHAEQAAVGNRPARGDGEPLRPVAGAQRVVDAVPHEPRAQLGELLGRVPAGEHLQRVAQQFVGQLGERRRAAHHRRHVGDGDLATGRDVGDDLLGEDVERVAQEPGVLDLAVDHPPGDDRRLEQVAAVLRVDRAAARLADLVAGAADALQATGNRPRRLDLDDEVDGAHVDAELEAARGDDGAQVAALELVLDEDALLTGERAVMGLDELTTPLAVVAIAPGAELLVVQLVELGRQPLRLAAGVAEHDGRAVGEDLFEDARVDRRPDARAARRHGDRRQTAVQPAFGLLLGRRSAEVGHVLDGDDDVDLQWLGDSGVDDGDVTRHAGR